jgi:exodeoxyribonuclease V alpha subunit
LLSYSIPQYGFTVDQVQILTPTNKKELGSRNLNQILQLQLNPPAPGKTEIVVRGEVFRVGDRVMQIQNNYDKKVFNGEMGIIKEIKTVTLPHANRIKHVISVAFDRAADIAEYSEGDLDQLVLSYAVTIHKSQGNEFPVVIIPLHMQQRRMLQRKLIYTAITRGKKLVVVVGDKNALQRAIENINAEGVARYTNLTDTITSFARIPESLEQYWHRISVERAVPKDYDWDQTVETEE